MPLLENKKHLDIFFHVFSFLMFGDDFNIGLDPAFKFDAFGKLLAITVDNRHFVVENLVYELVCLIGRATCIWMVHQDRKYYALKDSWVQEHHVHSEVSILQKMLNHDKIEDS